MKEFKTETKDPICGMNVDDTFDLHAEYEGKVYYFCGEECRKKFLSMPFGIKQNEKSGDCCG